MLEWMSQWCLGRPASAVTSDVTQMRGTWFAVGGAPVSAMGESHTVSVDSLLSQDYSTQETTASALMTTALIPKNPAISRVVDMDLVTLANHRAVGVHAQVGMVGNTASHLYSKTYL